MLIQSAQIITSSHNGILPSMRAYYTDFIRFFKSFFSAGRVYLDFVSATPLDRKMLKTFPVLTRSVLTANPSALHAEGVLARSALSDARGLVAQTLHAHPDEIFFTSGATESDNLAILGVIRSWIKEGVPEKDIAVVTSELEHAGVVEPLNSFSGLFKITLPLADGVVDLKGLQFEPHIQKVLVSIIFVSNEIGTVQPIKEIAKTIRRIKKQYPALSIIFHIDATQAPLYQNLCVDKLGIDLMTLGATKLYTHRGVGVLYKKRSIRLAPLLLGGGQEKGIRPGTESVFVIHHFAHALAYAQAHHREETEKVKALQTYFEENLLQKVPGVTVTAQNKVRTPHISHVAVPHFDSELLVLELDARGIAVSAKSACKNEEDTAVSITESLYGTDYGAVRFSFGRTTKKSDLDRAIKALVSVLKKYNRL